MGEHGYLVVTTSPATPEQVFDLLADAPRWREWAGSSVRESAWVTPTTDGVGAVRSSAACLSTPWRRSPIRSAAPDELHRGRPAGSRLRCTVELAPHGGGTEIRWSGRFTAPRLLGRRCALLRRPRQFAAQRPPRPAPPR
jgi:hypothetical protein